MTTSNVSTFQLTRNELIEAALRKLGVLAEGVSANATQLTTGQQAANLAIKYLQTRGMQSWKRTAYPITLITAQTIYTIGTGQNLNTPFPIHLVQAYLSDTSGSQIDIEIVSDYNYNLLPKTSSGTPVQLTYTPGINLGTLKVWPSPTSDAVADFTLYIVYQKPFDIFTASGETIDFAEEWQLALVYKTAQILADEFQLPLDDRRHIKMLADEYIKVADEFSIEEASVFFYPMKG